MKKNHKMIVYLTMGLWLVISIVFLVRIATMPENWTTVSVYNPMGAYFSFSAVMLIALCLQVNKWGTKLIVHRTEILKDGTKREYKVYDFGLIDFAKRIKDE